MLNRDTMAQLRGLKDQMESEKERLEGVLRGTTSRYGFVRVDDGREVFVPPDEMLKAFPGDRVRVCIRPGKDKRLVADIEGLVEGAVTHFSGRCVCKGKAVFVEPDLPDINRWLFIPPSARSGIAEGDYLVCKLLKHPIRDGKPQATVLKRIGAADDPHIENAYTLARHGIDEQWPPEALEEVEALIAKVDPIEGHSGREDFTTLAFVSIDAARTQDIDDALYAEVRPDGGWILYVAIADPTAYIDADSPLREQVRDRASSMYFHGGVVPMLPEVLAQQKCALAEDEVRPALVCRMEITEDGNVGDFKFFEGLIKSRAKLSYYAVDRYLNGQNDTLICHATPLEALYQASRALRTQREASGLVMEDRQEFRWVLNERGHIESIEPSEKLTSHRLVEECMVATNRCAAQLLVDSNTAGPFVVHDGFRRDRKQDQEAFLKAYLSEVDELDPSTLEGYRDLIKRLNSAKHELPLRAMLNRLLTRARLSKKPGAHMGMSLPAYTNCTSPLRKYLDFLVHLQIKAVIRGTQTIDTPQPELDRLSQRLLQLRKVSQEAERWLCAEYLTRLAQEDKAPWAGTVAYIGNEGINVRLDANGIEGFVALPMAHRKNKQGPKGKKNKQKAPPEMFTFDKLTATLQSKARRFRVDQAVLVSFAGVSEDPRYQPLFKLSAESGRIAVPAAKADAITKENTDTSASGPADTVANESPAAGAPGSESDPKEP